MHFIKFFKKIEAFLFLICISSTVFAADALCPPTTKLQKVAGYVSGYLEWMNFIKIIGILAVVAGACFIFSGVVRLIIDIFYKYLLEASLWVTSVGLVVGTEFISEDYQTWSLLIGSLLFPVAFIFSSKIRDVKGDPLNFSMLLTVIWSMIALAYQSPHVAFFAVGALISTLGFSVVVTPFCYYLGFKDDQAIARGTLASFFVSGVYLLARVFKLDFGHFAVFESGALWLAGFVFFIGLLIISTRGYLSKNEVGNNFIALNLITVVALMLFASLGMLFGVREITTLASTFMIFYFATKVIEVPTNNSISFGIKLLCAGGVVFLAWDWLNSHPELVKQYSLF